jgi:glucan-binding repeat-containing protein
MYNQNKRITTYRICKYYLTRFVVFSIVSVGITLIMLRGLVPVVHADESLTTLSFQSSNESRNIDKSSIDNNQNSTVITSKQTNNADIVSDTNNNHIKNNWIIQNGDNYYADENGNFAKGLQHINNNYYYFDATGKQIKNQIVNVNGHDMYFDGTSGNLVTNQDITIGNNHYHANFNGTLVKMVSQSPESLMTNTVFNQNFHYNTPRGYSNDIQSIVPHRNIDCKIDYYDVYYLYNPNPSYVGWANEWYHVTTKDFKEFTAYDKNNPTSLKNVAIPSPLIKNSDGNSSQMISNNQNVPWGYVATGSVINNNGLLKSDQLGNHIDKNAKLAYLTSFDAKQKIYLAYSNHDQQYHPYSSQSILSLDKFNITDGGGDFRDIVVQHNLKNRKQLVAYIAGGWSRRFYVATSRDGIKWNYSTKNNINMVPLMGDYPFEVETPIVKTINGHTMLFYSWHSGDNRTTSYVTGRINKNGLFELTKNSKIQDVDGNANKGDIYAGNYTNLDSHTLINMNWSGNWLYSPLGSSAYDNITKHSGSIALPRLIQYKNGHLVYIPVEPNNKLSNSYRIDSSNQPILVGNNNKLDFTFDNPNENKTITLKRSDSTLTINISAQGIRVIRNNHLNPIMNKDVISPLSTTSISKMELYVDNTSVEIYLPQANKSFNIVNYGSTSNEQYNMLVKGNGKLDNYKFESSDINSYNIIGKQSTRLQNNIKMDTRLANKFYKNNRVLLSLIRQANQQITVAKTNLKIVKRKSNDVRANLYGILASNAVQNAKELERQVTSYIMKLSNDGRNIFNTMNGIKVINGHQTWFVHGKRQSGKIIHNHYYDKQTGYLVKNTFYLLRNGSYYYFNSNGNMAKNQLVQTGDNTGIYYYFGSDGKAIKGAKNINGNQYFFDNYYRMIRNDFAKNNDGTLSYYDKDGKLVVTNFVVRGNNYTVNSLGVIQGDNIFVQSLNNSQNFYYLKNSHVATGIVNYSGKNYYFDNDGLPVTNNVIHDNNGNIKYYLDGNNKIVKNIFVHIGNNYYYFGNDGRSVVGAQIINGQKLYFNSHGIQIKGHFVRRANGNRYYYDADSGQLVTNQTRTINGTKYFFNARGITKVQYKKK